MGGGRGRRERGRVYEAYEVKNKRQKLRCLLLRRKKIYLFIYEVIKTETGRPPSRERTRHVDTRVHYLRELVRDDHVKLLKCAGPQNVADAPDQKPFASSPFQTSAIHVGHTYSFFSFLSLSKDWTGPDGVLQYHHTMRIPSRTRRLRNISSVCALVCMCVCRYDP